MVFVKSSNHVEFRDSSAQPAGLFFRNPEAMASHLTSTLTQKTGWKITRSNSAFQHNPAMESHSPGFVFMGVERMYKNGRRHYCDRGLRWSKLSFRWGYSLPCYLSRETSVDSIVQLKPSIVHGMKSNVRPMKTCTTACKLQRCDCP